MGSTVYTVGVKINGSAAGLAKAAKTALADTKAMGAGMGQEFSKMARARELLGVRSEAHIRDEILKTKAAYADLSRVGTLGWNDQRRAAKAMREEVTKLTNEMGRLTTRQKVFLGMRVAGGVAAGVGIAGGLAAPTVRKTMAYDLRLAHLANTAFNDRNSSGRVAGRRELDALVTDAVKFGGGTRDSAVDTAEALFGSGIFKAADVKAILREAVMAATANNADPASFAQMAISANQTMGIAPGQMGRLFGMGTYAGQSGGFEIKDMAKWLPQQMAAAKAVGLYGERGFAKLAALNQASVVTAGTKDEAGNNVVNLLAKMGSMDTTKDFKRMGINLPRQLAQGRVKGMDALDVVGNLLQNQLEQDKNYQQVQKALAAAKNDSERAKALSAVGDIAQGTVIGKVFQDRQALMALYAYLNARDRVNSITNGAMDNPQAALKNMSVIRDTASFKADQAVSAKDMAIQETMNKMLPAIGGVADGLTDLMQKYPGYTAAVFAATAAVTGLAGAAGLAALAMKGGAALPGGLGGGIGAGQAGQAAASSVGRFGRFMGGASKLAGPLGLLMMFEGVSDEDVARLKAYEARKARDAGGSGVRGQGFNDPRIVGRDISPMTFQDMLHASEARKARDAGGSGVRGQGFNDPRIVGRDISPVTFQDMLRASDARKARDAGGSGVRGQGFNDPRIVGHADSAAAVEQALRSLEVKGEIFVRVSAAPGLQVATNVTSANARISMKAALGQTNLQAGH